MMCFFLESAQEFFLLRGIKLVIFVAELIGLDSWGANIGNECLEEFTKEKAIIKAGQEFVPLQGHTLIIKKVLHVLLTSGFR